MMISSDNNDGVPVLLQFTKRSGMWIGFLNKDGEERWLKETSIVDGMSGVKVQDGTAHRTVFLKVREDIFKERRDELQDFVCDT